MDKNKYQTTADSFSNLMKRFFQTVSEVLENKYGISMILAGHVAFIHPGFTEVRGASFGMGSKEILMRIPDILKEELENYFQEFEAEKMKQDIISGFGKVLVNNKKPIIH